MAIISIGCDNCKFLTGKRCKLWQVKVEVPDDSHCESWQRIQCEYCFRTAITKVNGHNICEVCK